MITADRRGISATAAAAAAADSSERKRRIAMPRGSCWPDGSEANWRWLVAVSSFWVNFCVLGVLRSSAVIFVALQDNFPITREGASWPMGIFGFCMCITGVMSGYLSRHFSNRSIMLVGGLSASLAVTLSSCATNIDHVTALYGALQGAGVGFIVSPMHVTLNQHFSSHRAVAMGIACSGSSAGSFLFPPLAHWMVDEFGLSGAFILLGGIMLHSLPAIVLMRSPTKKVDLDCSETQGEKTSLEAVDGETMSGPFQCEQHCRDTGRNSGDERDVATARAAKESTRTESKRPPFRKCPSRVTPTLRLTVDVLSSPNFLIVSVAYAIYFSVSAIFLMVIVDFALERGMPKKHGVFLVSAFSFGDLAGRLACGWLGDLRCVKRRTVVSCYLLVMGGFMVVVPLCYTYDFLTVVSISLGVLNGSVIVNFSALLTESLGLQRLPLAVGFSSFAIGIVSFLRPVVIGYFRDQHKSYDLLFVALGAAQVIVAIPLLKGVVVKRVKFLYLLCARENTKTVSIQTECAMKSSVQR